MQTSAQSQPGRITPLTPAEVEEAFSSAPYIKKDHAEWRDVAGWRHRENDQPAVVYRDGAQFWLIQDDLHRENDLPACVWADGTLQWWRYGFKHRVNGLPTVLRPDGTMKWHVHGAKTGDQDNPPPDAVFPGQQTKSANKK